jgi:hypothetical protein
MCSRDERYTFVSSAVHAFQDGFPVGQFSIVYWAKRKKRFIWIGVVGLQLLYESFGGGTCFTRAGHVDLLNCRRFSPGVVEAVNACGWDIISFRAVVRGL